MAKIIKDGKIYGSTNSKDIKYNPSNNVLSLKTKNIQETIDEISNQIKTVKDIKTNVDLSNYVNKQDLKNTTDTVYKNVKIAYAEKSELSTINSNLDSSIQKNTTSIESNTANIEYLNLSKSTYYATANTMKQDTNIKENMRIKTFGFDTINDGGGSEYYINKNKPTNGPFIQLNNKLYAVMIIPKDNIINVLSLGLDKTGVNDCSAIINEFIKYSINVTLYFPQGLYNFKTTLTLNSNNYLNIIGDSKTYNIYDFYFDSSRNAKSRPGESILFFNNDNEGSTFININNGTIQFTADNITFTSKSGIFSAVDYQDRTSHIQQHYTYNTYIKGQNCIISNINIVRINQCKFYGFSNKAIIVNDNNIVSNCVFRACRISVQCKCVELKIINCDMSTGEIGIFLDNARYITIENCSVTRMAKYAYYSVIDNIYECYISGVIEDISYAGLCCYKISFLSLRAKMLRCGVYYAGADINIETLNLNVDEALDIYSKSTFIYVKMLDHATINISGYKGSILNDDTMYAAPCLLFGGYIWGDINVYGISKLELSDLYCDYIRNSSLMYLYSSGK